MSLNFNFNYDFSVKFIGYFFLLVYLDICLLPAIGWSQVNVEQNRPTTQEGFQATLDGSLTLIRGNVDLTQLGLTSKVEYVKGVHSPFIQASIDYGKRLDEVFLNQSFIHGRWTAMWWHSVGTEIFSQVQTNSFRSLVLRQLYGGGMRINFSFLESGIFALGLGTMFEREVYLDGQDLSSDQREILIENARTEQKENNLRGTSYLTLKKPLKLSESGAEIICLLTIYYQPLVNAPSDYRVLSDASIEVKLSERLRLVESLNFMYDSTPPIGVGHYDLKNVTSVRFVF